VCVSQFSICATFLCGRLFLEEASHSSFQISGHEQFKNTIFFHHCLSPTRCFLHQSKETKVCKFASVRLINIIFKSFVMNLTQSVLTPLPPCSCDLTLPLMNIYIYSYKQGCVIRSFGIFNTVEYALNAEYAYNTIVFLSNFGSADFWPKMDLISPKFTLNVPKSSPIYYYIIALEAHWKVVTGAGFA
jgi:hypothetical protein